LTWIIRQASASIQHADRTTERIEDQGVFGFSQAEFMDDPKPNPPACTEGCSVFPHKRKHDAIPPFAFLNDFVTIEAEGHHLADLPTQ